MCDGTSGSASLCALQGTPASLFNLTTTRQPAPLQQAHDGEPIGDTVFNKCGCPVCPCSCCAASGAQALPPSSVARLLREALLCVLHPLSRLESFTLLLTLPAASAMDMASLAGVLEATLQVRACLCLRALDACLCRSTAWQPGECCCVVLWLIDSNDAAVDTAHEENVPAAPLVVLVVLKCCIPAGPP